MTAPVFRPNFEKAIKDVHDRVKILEANPNGGTITEITSTGGTVAITNPFGPVTNLEASGGGMVATDWEYITGGGASIATGTFPLTNWVHSAGQTFLNYGTPTVPSFIAAGVYAVAVNPYYNFADIPGSGIGVIEARFEVTYASGSSAFIQDAIAPLRGGANANPGVTFAWTGGVDAGDVMELFIGQTSGNTRAVAFEAFLQKLS